MVSWRLNVRVLLGIISGRRISGLLRRVSLLLWRIGGLLRWITGWRISSLLLRRVGSGRGISSSRVRHSIAETLVTCFTRRMRLNQFVSALAAA